jgi:hypothetical protein
MKKNGEFFLYIKGGPYNKYRPGKPQIKPLSKDEVKKWVKLYFGDEINIGLYILLYWDDHVEYLYSLYDEEGGKNNA